MGAFLGPRCQTPVCRRNCSDAGMCVSDKGQPTCVCAKGFTGADCSQEECHDDRCFNGGICISRAGITECSCKPGWSGPTCLEKTEEINRTGAFAAGALSDGVILVIIMIISCLIAAAAVALVFWWRSGVAKKQELDMQRHESQQASGDMY